MSSILITGGNGYLGQHLLAHLRSQQHAGAVFYTFCTGPALPSDVQVQGIELDFETASVDDCAVVLSKCNPDVIVHLAAWSALAQCEKQPQRALQINAPAALVEAAAGRTPCPLIIYTSTDQVYGQHSSTSRESSSSSSSSSSCSVFTETSVCTPLNEYGKSKLAFELLLRDSSLPYIVLRLSNMIGPASPYTKTGKFLQWLHEQLIAPSADHKQQPPLELYSDERRNFVYVTDVVHVIASAIAKQAPSAAAAAASAASDSHTAPGISVRETYNVGGDRSLSRAELGEMCAQALQQRAQRSVQAQQRSATSYPSPLDLSMDSSKLWSALVCTPTGMAQALQNTFHPAQHTH